MTLNTYVTGNPDEARSFAQELRKIGNHTESTATGAHQARSHAEGEWDGAASDAFQEWAKKQGTDGDALAEVYPTMARAHDALAAELDTVKARMEQAKQVARDGGLTVRAYTIMPPTPFTAVKPDKPQGRMSAGDSERYANDMAVFEAAQARHAKQQAAWEEAKTTVEAARQKERAAHETFVSSLDNAKEQLKGISQAQEWAKAGMHPTSAAASGLATAATAMESSSAEAAKSMFERASGNGPAAVNAAWTSMSSAQRADLIDQYPRMVGSTDGVPATDRHAANITTLNQQRAALREKLVDAKRRVHESLGTPGGLNDIAARELEQAEQSLAGLDRVQQVAQQDDKFLLNLDAAANGRGQVVIASGNPDTADHVATTVPGTYSDLSSATDYVAKGDKMAARAEEMAPNDESVSAVTWIDYEAPGSLVNASEGRFAEHAKADLNEFQEGLRVTHQGEPSNNTVIGHSYGTTTIGYAARDGDLNTDNIVFMGSPGVGVEHARDLGVPPENVWSGTNTADPIGHFTPSPNPIDGWKRPENLVFTEPSDDQHWFGRDPSNVHFGARELPTNSWAGHSSYWDEQESLDGMARVVSGRT